MSLLYTLLGNAFLFILYYVLFIIIEVYFIAPITQWVVKVKIYLNKLLKKLKILSKILFLGTVSFSSISSFVS